MISNKNFTPWKLWPEGCKAPWSRWIAAPRICIPGFLLLLSLTKETAREGGREDSASDTFCRQKSLCQHDALAEGAGTMVAALPSGRSPHSCPLPWKPPFCGEQQAL